MRRLTTEEFISKAKKVHNDEYCYSLVNYVNNKVKVNILCHKHGIFKQQPNNHINNKQKCPFCADISLINHNKSQRLTSEEFIFKAKEVHGNKYDYSLVNYLNKKTKVDIICDKHGVFSQKPISTVPITFFF